MIKRISKYILVSSLVFVGVNILAEETSIASNKVDTEEINDVVLVEESKSSSSLLAEKFQSYISEYNEKRVSKNKNSVSYGQAFDDGKLLITGIARIPGNENSKQWAKQRSMAFTNAYLKAMEKFALYQNKKVRVDIGKKLFQDDSDDAGKIKEEKLGELSVIWNKLKALTGAQLDNALVEMGIDPEKFNSTPSVKRKNMFFNSIAKTTITSASSHTRGFLPIKTYEGKGEDGTYSVGVVCMYSHKMKQVAVDISKQREPILKKKTGINLNSYVNNLTSDQLLNSFGPRLLFDQNGEPAIISFGQWGYSYTGNNSGKKERMKMNASRTARSNADSNIALMLKGTMSTKEEVKTNMEESEYNEQIGDDFPIEKMETKMVDILNSQMHASAKVNMPGTGTMKTWSLKHPNGQNIVGVVQVLTFSGIRGAKSTRNFVPKTKKVVSPKKIFNGNSSNSKTITKGHVNGGATVDVDDF